MPDPVPAPTPERSGVPVDARRRGLMLVLSSPSGAGKTTLAKRLLAEDDRIAMSVSMTTRPMRPGEREGVDYVFVGVDEFRTAQVRGQLLEWAQVFDNFYGTPRAPVEAAMAAGRDFLFDVDWQGARQLGAAMPDDLVRVFILPPTVAALRERLIKRNQDAPEVVARRMAKVGGEICHWPEYDYVIVNRDVEASLAGLRAILAAERLKRSRRTGLADFVEGLMQGLDLGRE